MFEKKSQIVSTDLFFAVSVFVIIIAMIFFSWNLYYERIDERIIYGDMMANAFQVSDLLVKSKGTPSLWNSTNVSVVGLASSDRNISSQKLHSFINVPYDELKKLFNIERYEFYFRLKHLNGTPIDSHGKEFDGTYSINTRRYVIYENQKAIIDFRLWK